MEQSNTGPGAGGLPAPSLAAQQHFWLFHGPLYQKKFKVWFMQQVCFHSVNFLEIFVTFVVKYRFTATL
jgi:hypothetical protein